MPRQLLVDCSSTRTCEFNSGIQRVVRSLCKEACEQRSEYVGRAVFGDQGDWYEAKSLWPTQVPAQSPTGRKTLRSRLRKLSKKVAKKLFPSVNLNGRPLLSTLKQGDVLLMADAGWMYPNWEGIRSAKHRGVRVGYIIYDLLPLDYPQFFPSKLVTAFGSWFEQVAQSADFLTCISQSVRSNVVRRLSAHPATSDLAYRTGWFKLGCELKESRSANTTLSSELATTFSGKNEHNPWLMVGTLEPRKNHSFVLDSFESLWREGRDERLAIIGRVGWNCDSLIQRIRSHPEFGKRLFMSNHSNDSEVEYAYRRAKGVITSSWDEGYGLPIVEGLHYNHHVVASDIPVHREVGQDFVHYFSLDNPRYLAELLVRFQDQSSFQALRGKDSYSLTTWAESYRSLIASIEDLIPQCARMAA